jgi:hypothetical protein
MLSKVDFHLVRSTHASGADPAHLSRNWADAGAKNAGSTAVLFVQAEHMLQLNPGRERLSSRLAAGT